MHDNMSRDTGYYASIQRVRFDDDLPLSEQSIRRSCRQLYRSLYNQQVTQFRGPKPIENSRNFVAPPNGNPFCYAAPSPYGPDPGHPPFLPAVDAYAIPANAQMPDPYWNLQPGSNHSLKKGRKYSSELSLNGGIKSNGEHNGFPPNGACNGERSLFLRQMILPNGETADMRAKNLATSTENLVVPKISVKRRSSVCSSYTDITCRQAVVTPTKEYCSRKDRMRRRSASSVSLHAFSLGRDGNLWVPELRKRYGLPPDSKPPWPLENGRADLWTDRQCNFCSRNELHPVTTFVSNPQEGNDYFEKDPHAQQLIPTTPRMIGRREMKALANGTPPALYHSFRQPKGDFLPNGHLGSYHLGHKHKEFDTRSCIDSREMHPVYDGVSHDMPRTRPSSSMGTNKDSNERPLSGRPEDFKGLEQKRDDDNKTSAQPSVDKKAQTSSTEITNEGSGSSSCSSLPDDFLSSQTTTGRSVTLSPFSSRAATLDSSDFLNSQRKIVYKSDSAIHMSSRIVRKKSFLQKICEAARSMRQSLRRALSQENLKQSADLAGIAKRAEVERNNSLRDSLFREETNSSGSEHEAHVTGQLIQVHQDGSLLVELTKNPKQKTYGLYLAKGRVRNHKGVFVCRMVNSKVRADLAGLLELGDEILQVNGMMANSEDISRINQVLATSTTIMLTVMPYSYRNSLVYY